METCEALVLRKSSYGEADLLVTLFSRELGKFRALAKNAKKSRKRFGGRLDFFNRLAIEVTLNKGRFNLIGDVTLKKSYREITESVDSFVVATRVLELLDFLTPEQEPGGELFDLVADTLGLLSEKREAYSVFLVFFLRALTLCGFRPDLRFDREKDIAGFDVENGKLGNLEKTRGKRNIYPFHMDIMRHPEIMDANLEKVKNNIRILTRYAEYRTGRHLEKTGFADET
ncbi:MAG: DNA repair protein RecO [Candidatus Dadabacteria bacterium]|nr:DNA repair protein RecO [Candidatus Dadabacteria bacterium]